MNQSTLQNHIWNWHYLCTRYRFYLGFFLGGWHRLIKTMLKLNQIIISDLLTTTATFASKRFTLSDCNLSKNNEKKNKQSLKMVSSMDKVILMACILCCAISLAACQDAPEANNSSDLSEGLFHFIKLYKNRKNPLNSNFFKYLCNEINRNEQKKLCKENNYLNLPLRIVCITSDSFQFSEPNSVCNYTKW